MVVDRSSTPSTTAARTAVTPAAATRPADGAGPGRRRLARVLTAAAATGALLVPAAGAAVAAPGEPSSGAAASGSEAACLSASFPAGQTWTTAAAVDEWLACTGLTDGAAYADPGLTRGEAAQIAYRSVGADEASTAGVFTDVSSGTGSATAINWLASAGIVRGYADGEFKPDRDITRDELARVLVGAALTGAEPVAAEGTGAAESGASDREADAEASASSTAAEAPQEDAAVGSAASEYEQDANAFMAEYGCEGTAVDIVDTTSMEGATGVTTVTEGVPATVQIRSGMDQYMLEHTAAHECMHVMQHAVSGYDPATLEAMLSPYYSAEYTTSWGRVDIYEQNAECAVRTLGFSQAHSNYDVTCTDTMLDAGQAIALGHDPREVVAAE